MAKRIYKSQTSSKKSIFIALALTLVMFVVAGFLLISYFDEFYHSEKTQEATLLAKSYANTLESTLDARALLTEQFHTTLRVAGTIVSQQKEPFSNEMLVHLANALNVDVLYVYDSEGRVEYSSDGLYVGWIAPQDHPVRTFYDSGLDHYVDEIRTDSETDTYWMYSYQKYEGGRMIQSGILADRLAELYAQLTEQWIIEQIAQDSPLIQIAFINPENIITASSNPSEIGHRIDERVITDAKEEGTTSLSCTGMSLGWHLTLYLPIQVNEIQIGTLSLLFDLSNTNKLFVRIAVTITAVLITIFILFAISIVNIANKNRRIFTVAYFDEVTTLPNIKYLKRVLLEKEHKNLALILVNPLHFKFINLIYGYSYGDELLYKIAKNLSSIAFKGVSLQAFRFTDDQFIITVNNYGSQTMLSTICNRILTIHEEPGILGGIDLTLGVVEWKKEGLAFDTLIKEASIAVSAANKTNRIQFYSQEIESQIQRQDSIETELKRVVAKETDILTLVYQPIVEAKSGSIVSFEALARLESPILGGVSPLEFIGIAEKRHLIIPLGKIILEKATHFIQKLSELGYGSYPVAVNVSALQLLDESFVESLKQIVKKSGIRPEQLEIELTESVFSNNFVFLSRQLEKIHAMGIRVAIDDFGTGFSSLNRLGNLVVDKLKLDKQFVDKLGDASGSDISMDIISMAHHLDKQIIAEGVETEEQRQILLGMGCTFMQGYLFSKPVSQKDCITLLMAERGGN